MKLLLALVILIFIQKALFYETGEGKNKDVKNNMSMLPYSYICDDEKLQNIEEKLKRVEENDENLRLILNTMKSIINHRFETDEKRYEKSSLKSKSYLPTSCAEAFEKSGQRSGIHKIYLPESKLEPFFVNCLADAEQPESPWTIIQRRQDGAIDFYRKWNEYQKGFGNMEGEFFIGLDILHALTQSTLHELWIEMRDFRNGTASANYSSFAIGDSSEAYAFKILGSFVGNAGDSLRLHVGQKFTTQDVDNDVYASANCAVDYQGAWWYQKCHYSNLNGKYLGDKIDGKGISWYHWHDNHNSLKYVHMAIRPVVYKNERS